MGGEEIRGPVWVAGASSGIGRAIVVELAEQGWRVGAGARRLDALDELARSLKGRVETAALDVCSPASIASWTATLRERTGDPHALVYAAGWGIFEKVVATTDEDWQRTIDTNLTGLFRTTRAVLPSMLARGSGQIVVLLSVAARAAFPKNGAYNASKFGALGFTEALRAETRRHGIRVTAVLPGATDTPFWDRLAGDWDRSRMQRPEAVARAVRTALEAGPESMVEEIRIAPQLGNL